MYIIWKIDGNCFYHCLVLSCLAAWLLKDLLGEGTDTGWCLLRSPFVLFYVFTQSVFLSLEAFG